MKNSTVSIFVPLTKVDEDKREVSGYATTEALDSQGEIVKSDAVERALTDYMKWANIREMHQPSAVGTAVSAIQDDKGLFITAKIVDDQAWKKVVEKVYKGFSIGGRKLVQKGNEIMDLMLTEISIVDRPSNPEAVFEMVKRDYSKAESNGEKSQDDIRSMLYHALHEWAEETIPMVSDFDCGYFILEVFSDHFVASQYGDNTNWSFPYTIQGDTAVLGEPVEVKLVWENKGAEKAETPSMAKMLGYTPHWIKLPSLFNKEHMTEKPELKKEEAAPVEEPKDQPAPEVKVEEPVVETPAEEKKPEETPADEPKAPEEKVEEKPAETPAEKAEVLTDDEKKLMKSAIGLFAKLLGEAAPSTNEKADVGSDIAKVAGDEIAKAVSETLEKAAKANDDRFAKLEGQVAEMAKTIQPVKARAGFALVKGEEGLGEGQPKGEALEKLDALKKRAEELLDLKKSISGAEYQAKYAAEAQKVFADLRSLEASAEAKA